MRLIIKFIFCGIITALIFPPFSLLPLGFISFPYLIYLLTSKKLIFTKKLFQFNLGFIFGISMNSIILIWIREPFLLDDNTRHLSFLSFFLIIYCSLYYGLVFLILSFFSNKISKILLIPILFVGVEILRENFLYGFAWITFAQVYSINNFLLSLIYYLGTYGLSYFVILIYLIPSSVFLIFNSKKKFILTNIIISLSVLFIGLSLIYINKFKDLNNQKYLINVSIIQLNSSQVDRNNHLNLNKRLKYIEDVIKTNKSELIIFSENDFPYTISNLNDLNFLQKYLNNKQSIIIGGIRKENNDYFNTLYLVERENIQFFDKKKLVPFGEFLPLRNIFSSLDKIVGEKDFKSGKDKRIITTLNNLNIIPIICYEIIFHNELLDNTNISGDLMINITNDSWFGNFSGPYQHFYLSKMRAVEFNKFLIRSSNNGISAMINSKGEIIEFLPLNKKGISTKEITIYQDLNNLTTYHFFIYFFMMIILIVSIFINSKNYE